MQTGGMPDITNALGAIETRARGNIEDSLAGIRETFSGQGLGLGSDIADALGRGASRGYADLAAQQSTLIAQLMDAAQNRRLGAASGAGALSGQNFGNELQRIAMQLGILQLPNQTALANAGVQQSALGLAPSLSGMAINPMLQGAQGMGTLGMFGAQNNQQNLMNLYNEFVRMQQPNPYLNPAIAFATSNPNQQQQIVPEGPGIGSTLVSGGLGVLGAILPWLLFSSRTLKEDIEPVDKVSDRLKSLNIYRWKYKGDNQKHIGPMAEEWQDTFGIGDGKTLSLFDMLGVLLASQKELHAQASPA